MNKQPTHLWNGSHFYQESIEKLTAEYDAFLKEHNYPELSADELMHEVMGEIADKQDHVQYLKSFIERWEITQEREDEEEESVTLKEVQKAAKEAYQAQCDLHEKYTREGEQRVRELDARMQALNKRYWREQRENQS